MKRTKFVGQKEVNVEKRRNIFTFYAILKFFEMYMYLI